MSHLLTTASALSCPHQGQVHARSSNTRASADGAWLLRASDTFTVSGCTFTVSGNPHPCVRVEWPMPASRSRVDGDFVLTQDSLGLCLAADNVPQGTVRIHQTQPRVSGAYRGGG